MTLKSLTTLVISALILTHCSIDEPFLPSWDTRVQVNFRSEEFVARDILKDDALHDSLNSQLGDTLLYYSLSDSLAPQKVDQADLTISSTDDRIVKQVGKIHIDAPGTASTPPLGLIDLFPGLTIAIGAVLPPIPDQNLAVQQQKVSFDNFLQVDVDSAKAHVIFYNDLIFDIRPGMQITLYDSSQYSNQDSGRIGAVTFNAAIPRGSSSSSNILDLAGKTLSSSFYVRYKIPIKGTSSSKTLTQEDINSSFHVDVIISDIQVSRAVAKIPEQRVEESQSTSIDTKGKSVRRAHISSGNILLTIGNHLDVGAGLEISLLNLLDDQNNPYVINLDLNANTSSSVTANLSGYTLKNHLTDGAPVSELAYRVVALTHPSKGFVAVQSTDSIEVDVSSSDISVDHFEGDVGTIDLSLDPVTQDNLLNTADFNGTFKVPDVVFTMNFFNQINFDIDLDLMVTGYHKDSASGQITDSVHVKVGSRLNRGSSAQPSVTKIILDGKNASPNIVDLMSILPTSIKVVGGGQVSGDGSLNADDAVWMKYTVESPLSIQIDTPIDLKTDVAELTSSDIDSATQDRIVNDLSIVSLHVNSVNGLPVAADVWFSISNDSLLLFSNEATSGGKVITQQISLNAGATDVNGLVTTPAQDVIKLELTNEQLQLFNTLPLYYKSKITIKSSPNKIVVRSRDKITVDGNIDINFQVNSNGI